VKRAVNAAATPDDLLKPLLGWNPGNDVFVALAKKCGVSGSSERKASDVATLLLAGKLLVNWSTLQLTSRGTTVAELDAAWAKISPEARVALARHWAAGASGEPPTPANEALRSLWRDLHPADQAAVAMIASYGMGRAILGALSG
jgi:hypothetical protein